MRDFGRFAKTLGAAGSALMLSVSLMHVPAVRAAYATESGGSASASGTTSTKKSPYPTPVITWTAASAADKQDGTITVLSTAQSPVVQGRVYRFKITPSGNGADNTKLAEAIKTANEKLGRVDSLARTTNIDIVVAAPKAKESFTLVGLPAGTYDVVANLDGFSDQPSSEKDKSGNAKNPNYSESEVTTVTITVAKPETSATAGTKPADNWTNINDIPKNGSISVTGLGNGDPSKVKITVADGNTGLTDDQKNKINEYLEKNKPGVTSDGTVVFSDLPAGYTYTVTYGDESRNQNVPTTETAAPSAPDLSSESGNEGLDGNVTKSGVITVDGDDGTTTYEYKTPGTDNWTSFTGSETDVNTPGVYQVRQKGNENTPTGASSYTVVAFGKDATPGNSDGAVDTGDNTNIPEGYKIVVKKGGSDGEVVTDPSNVAAGDYTVQLQDSDGKTVASTTVKVDTSTPTPSAETTHNATAVKKDGKTTSNNDGRVQLTSDPVTVNGKVADQYEYKNRDAEDSTYKTVYRGDDGKLYTDEAKTQELELENGYYSIRVKQQTVDDVNVPASAEDSFYVPLTYPQPELKTTDDTTTVDASSVDEQVKLTYTDDKDQQQEVTVTDGKVTLVSELPPGVYKLVRDGNKDDHVEGSEGTLTVQPSKAPTLGGVTLSHAGKEEGSVEVTPTYDNVTSLKVYDNTGKLVKTFDQVNGTNLVTVDGLAPGTYTVTQVVNGVESVPSDSFTVDTTYDSPSIRQVKKNDDGTGQIQIVNREYINPDDNYEITSGDGKNYHVDEDGYIVDDSGSRDLPAGVTFTINGGSSVIIPVVATPVQKTDDAPLPAVSDEGKNNGALTVSNADPAGSYTIKSKDGNNTYTGKVDSQGVIRDTSGNPIYLPAGEYEVTVTSNVTYEMNTGDSKDSKTSEAGTFVVTLKPATPVVEETTAADNGQSNGVIDTNLPEGTKVEYKAKGSDTWTPATVDKDGKISVPGGDYELRVAGDDSKHQIPSDSVAVHVGQKPAAPAQKDDPSATSVAGAKGGNLTVSNPVKDGTYTITDSNNNTVTATVDENGVLIDSSTNKPVALDPGTYSVTVSVKDGNATLESPVGTFTVKEKAATPEATNPTVADNAQSNGQIATPKLTEGTTVEYKKDGDSNYTTAKVGKDGVLVDDSGNAIGLPGGTYQVRIPATDNVQASDPVNVVVKEKPAAPVQKDNDKTPAASVAGKSEGALTVKNPSAGAVYTVTDSNNNVVGSNLTANNDGVLLKEDGTPLTLNPGTYSVVAQVPGDDSSKTSAGSFTVKEKAATPEATNPTLADNGQSNGQIATPGLTAGTAVEYKGKNDTDYKKAKVDDKGVLVDTESGAPIPLAPGDYQVRIPANGDVLASDPADVRVLEKPAAPAGSATPSKKDTAEGVITLSNKNDDATYTVKGPGTDTTTVTLKTNDKGELVDPATGQPHVFTPGDYTVTATVGSGDNAATSPATTITVAEKPAAPTVTTTLSNNGANDGSITVTNPNTDSGVKYQIRKKGESEWTDTTLGENNKLTENGGTNFAPGEYEVRVVKTPTGGTEVASDITPVTVYEAPAAPIQDLNNYANPAQTGVEVGADGQISSDDKLGVLTVTNPDKNATYTVKNNAGTTVATGKVNDKGELVDNNGNLLKFEHGNYTVTATVTDPTNPQSTATSDAGNFTVTAKAKKPQGSANAASNGQSNGSVNVDLANGTTVEYQLNGGTWTKGTVKDGKLAGSDGTVLDSLAPKTQVRVRIPADDTNQLLASDPLEVTINEIPAAPAGAGTKSHVGEKEGEITLSKLPYSVINNPDTRIVVTGPSTSTGTPETKEYKVNTDGSLVDDQGNTPTFAPGTYSVSIKNGDGTSTSTSINVTPIAKAPEANGVDTTTTNGTDGHINTPQLPKGTEVEYRPSGSDDNSYKKAKVGDNGQLVDDNGAAIAVPSGNYQVRVVSGTDNGLAVEPSDPTEVEVFDPAPRGLDSNVASGADQKDGKITGLDANTTYQYRPKGSTEWIDVPAGTSIDGLAPGTYEVRTNNGTGTSRVTELTVATAETPAAPANLNGVAVTKANANDGKITGLDGNTSYEYRKKGSTEWTTVPAGATTVENLAPGDYEVRVAAKDGNPASAASTVTVNDAATPEGPLDLGGQNASTETTNDGKITGLDASRTYEYRKQGSTEWISVPAGSTSINDLLPGTYEVRFAASEGTPASAAVTVEVGYGEGNGKKPFVLSSGSSSIPWWVYAGAAGIGVAGLFAAATACTDQMGIVSYQLPGQRPTSYNLNKRDNDNIAPHLRRCDEHAVNFGLGRPLCTDDQGIASYKLAGRRHEHLGLSEEDNRQVAPTLRRCDVNETDTAGPGGTFCTDANGIASRQLPGQRPESLGLTDQENKNIAPRLGRCVE